MHLAEELNTMPNLKCHYVKGHEDTKKKYITLPERYNVEADAKATILRFRMQQPAHKVIPIPASTVNTLHLRPVHQLITQHQTARRTHLHRILGLPRE